jgi:hypothetical protein
MIRTFEATEDQLNVFITKTDDGYCMFRIQQYRKTTLFHIKTELLAKMIEMVDKIIGVIMDENPDKFVGAGLVIHHNNMTFVKNALDFTETKCRDAVNDSPYPFEISHLIASNTHVWHILSVYQLNMLAKVLLQAYYNS